MDRAQRTIAIEGILVGFDAGYGLASFYATTALQKVEAEDELADIFYWLLLAAHDLEIDRAGRRSEIDGYYRRSGPTGGARGIVAAGDAATDARTP